MLKKIHNIIEGFFFLMAYKLDLITNPKILSIVGQRKMACNSCPLRSGNWCDKNKSISIQTKEKQTTALGVAHFVHYKISGCGCYLPAKYLSDFNFTENPCPRRLWKKARN